MKKIVFLLLLISLFASCDYKNHKGEVVDKVNEKEADTYINTGNGVMIPIIGNTSYYIVIENEDGERERVGVKTRVYDQFDIGDNFSNKDNKVYKNGELIYE